MMQECSDDIAKRAIHKALEEAAELNYKKFREYEEQAQKETTQLNNVKINNLARGFKYAAKICLSLKDTY